MRNPAIRCRSWYLFVSVALFVLIPSDAKGQLSLTVEEIEQRIETAGTFGGQSQSREILEILSTIDATDLDQLITQGEPLTCVYAFWAYSRQDHADFRKYFPKLVYDNRQVEVPQGHGCLVPPPKSVGRCAFDIAQDIRGYYGTRNKFPFYLDSLSIELDIRKNWDIRGHVNMCLMNMDSEELYPGLRRLAEKGNVSATIGLANYRMSSDTAIIQRLLVPESTRLLYGLMSVEKFPHQAFEQELLSVFNYKMDQEYPLGFGYVCELLMNYDSENVTQAFDRLLANPDKYYYQTIQLWFRLQLRDSKTSELAKRLVKKVGRKELNKRVDAYRQMNYWVIANRANRN